MKTSIAILGISAAALLGAQALPAHAGDYGDNGPVRYGYAKVVRVEPLVRMMDVSYPRRECWNEQVTRYDDPGPASATPTIVGGIVGGVLGHQVGKGNGRTVGAIAGTLLGASVARDLYRDSRRPVAYTDTVQRCRVREAHRTEQRIDGYRVTYRYRGQTFTSRMARDPGERIRVQVAVTPID